MIDDWHRIIFGETIDRRSRKSHRVHTSQLRQPGLDIFAGWIVAFRLTPRILHPEIWSGIGSGSRTPLPTPVVRSDIAIHQFLHKILFSFPPVDMEVFRQEHGHDHPHPIVHKTSRIELSHTGIDDGKSRVTNAPPLES